ncbi:hypothetical protein AVEN_225894-1 [Araneus ventricosus]|uniref:Uncharacterized protein n=1 Tax=Araneus ventricosus TaxID=182803 RepID=A0A4Y2BBE9_ARAVE|nr:hypothetical protein AVEN_225894-1 [Araneus ventricosus]
MNHAQMTLELAPPLQTFTSHQREDVRPLRMIYHTTGPGRTSVESGFEPGTLRPLSRDLTTRPPLPYELLMSAAQMNELSSGERVDFSTASTLLIILMSYPEEGEIFMQLWSVTVLILD